MESMLTVALVAAFAVSSVSANFVIVPIGFGDMNDPEVSAYVFGKCEESCKVKFGLSARCSFTHPRACNLYVECLRFGKIWVIHGRVAPEGSVYNERTGHTSRAFLPPNIPNLAVCENNGHPCETGKPVPINAGQCSGYMMCENSTMVPYQCPEGTGFSAWSGQCDIVCNLRKRRVLETKCGPSPRGEYFLQINETIVYGDSTIPVLEVYDNECPATTSYQVMGKCGCDRYNVTVKPCETVSVVHFSSSDNSWELAKNNTPINGGGAITGDAEVVDPSDRNYRRSAFFEGGKRFISERLNGNDLGLYFSFSFTIQSIRDNNVRGFNVRADDNVPVTVALADNSGDEKEATYGCMLRVLRTNRGQVVCYVRPSKANGDKDRNDVTIDGGEVDLTKRISVQFQKDNTRGRLTITEEGSAENPTEFQFPTGIRAIGNLSPLVIGAGTGKRPFTGYIDDMDLRKYCGTFMSKK